MSGIELKPCPVCGSAVEIEQIEQPMCKGKGGKAMSGTWYNIWALLFGHCRYIVIVGASNNAANGMHRVLSVPKTTRVPDSLSGTFGKQPDCRSGGCGFESRRPRCA